MTNKFLDLLAQILKDNETFKNIYDPNDPMGGNTKTPIDRKISEEKKEYVEGMAKNWCFTVYCNDKYTLDEIEIQMIQKIQHKKLTYVFGREICPDTKRPHLQCYISFAVKQRLKTLLGNIYKYDTWHKAVCKGDEKDNYRYCTKEGNFKTNIKMPKSIGALKKKEIELYGWQLEAMEHIKSCAQEQRRILWIFDRQGNSGKNVMCEYLVAEYGAVIMGGCDRHIKSQVMDNLDCELFIINVTRDGGGVSYSAIEAVRDGLFASYFGTKNNGMVRLKHYPVIVVFSNDVPDTSKFSKDRWFINEINSLKQLVTYKVK